MQQLFNSKRATLAWIIIFTLSITQSPCAGRQGGQKYPVAKPGLQLQFIAVEKSLPASVIQNFILSAGDIELKNGLPYQWVFLKGEKGNGRVFTLRMLVSAYPPAVKEKAEKVIARYITANSASELVEYVDKTHGTPLLPNTGAWKYLLPQSEDAANPFAGRIKKIELLGHEYTLHGRKQIKCSFLS